MNVALESMELMPWMCFWIPFYRASEGTICVEDRGLVIRWPDWTQSNIFQIIDLGR